MKYNWSDSIAAAMNATLQDAEFQKIFASEGAIEKVAFRKVSDDSPTEVEVEFATEMAKEPIDTQLVQLEPAAVVLTAKEGQSMDSLVKVAFDHLLKISSDLEEAGFEDLSGDALVLADNLIVEAKAKKSKKDMNKAVVDKAKADKAKAKAKLEKERVRELKDKNDARAKKEKSKKDAKK